MATVTAKRLCLNQPNTTYGTAYTAPASPSTSTVITDIEVVNPHTAAVSLTINIVPSGGSADATNYFYYQRSIAKNGGTLPWQGRMVMNPGDTIQVKASVAGKLVVIASGVEIA